MNARRLALLILLPLAAAPAAETTVPVAPPGFAITLAAREPLLRNPCALAFDARGRLFVGQGPQYRNPRPDTPGDTVELLIDTDGDGIYDRAKTFARGLNCIQGLAWRGRDLYIANSPDLTIVRDTDGDDEADEYVLLYTDLGNIEHALHGLNFGPDGKLYMSKGNSKGLNQPGRVAPKPFRELHGQPDPPGAPDFPPPRTFTKENYRATYQDPKDDWGRRGGILRANPDGTGLEIVARGFRNPWDIAFDAGFDWLGTDNDQSDGDRIVMPFFGADFGWSHAWSAHWTGRGHLPTVPVSGPVFAGSGTGIVFADTPGWPAAQRGVWFINDFLHRTTYLYRPTWEGALVQPADGKWEPWIRGGDALFNPVDLEHAPDGSLLITGWGKALGAEFRDGRQTNEGRLFRVRPTGGGAAAPTLVAGTSAVSQLTAALGSAIPAVRTDAAEELLRRGAAGRRALEALLAGGALPTAQETWALWTLGRFAPDDAALDAWFATAGAARSPNARIQALRIVAHRLRESRRADPWPAFLGAALRDAEPRVRMAALLAVAQAPRATLRDAVLAAAATETDRVAFYAAWHALGALADDAALRALLRDARGGVRRAALLGLADRGALDEPQVRGHLADADPDTAALAALWLARRDGNPLLDISPQPGDFVDTVRVKIVPGLKPAVVRFTVDGTEPRLAKNEDNAKLTFTATTTLKAALFVNGQKVGNTFVGTYRKLTPPAPPAAVVLTPPAAAVTAAQVLAALPGADAARGRAIFHAAGCIACHRAGSEGGAFGPDLTGLGARGNVGRIVRSVLEPSAEIAEGFALHTYTLRDGREIAGRILEEGQGSFSVVQPDGRTATIARADIVRTATAPVSAMPPYDRAMSAAEVAALVAWLTRP